VRNVDLDQVAFFDQRNFAALRSLRADVADRQAGGAARETAVGEQGAGFAEPLGLQLRGWVEHFLHAGAAFRAFVADHHHVAGLDAVGQNRLDGVFLALENPRRAAAEKVAA
jgi:hypothetical protein